MELDTFIWILTILLKLSKPNRIYFDFDIYYVDQLMISRYPNDLEQVIFIWILKFLLKLSKPNRISFDFEVYYLN